MDVTPIVDFLIDHVLFSIALIASWFLTILAIASAHKMVQDMIYYSHKTKPKGRQ